MTFDPRSCGARCDLCLLRTMRVGDPVPSKVYNVNHDTAVVGEAPGEDEVAQGMPFVGDSGKLLMNVLRQAGVQRADVNWHNAVACRPPDKNNMTLIENKTRAANKQIAKGVADGTLPPETPYMQLPSKACHPRLLRELEGYANLLVVGKTALQAVRGGSTGILDARGGMIEGWLQHPGGLFTEADGAFKDRPPIDGAQRLKVLPTLHPAHVLRQRRWMRAFQSDVHRANRWFHNVIEWIPPRVTYQPTAEELYNWLAFRPDGAAYDTETDGIQPLIAKLRCVSIGDTVEGLVIPFLSMDGAHRFYPPAEERRVRDVLRAWFTDKRAVKFGWNNGYYDRLIIEQHFGVTPAPILDGMMMHPFVESELPHSLAYAASIYAAMAPAWKATRTATTARDDHSLHVYAGMDAVQTARVCPPILDTMRLRDQGRIFKVMRGMQSVAGDMHRLGLLIDQKRCAEWVQLKLGGGVDPREAAKAAAKGDKPPKAKRGALYDAPGLPSYLTELRGLAGRFGFRADFNPNSVMQLRELWFDVLQLPVPDGANGRPKMTKGGDPSTDDETVRALMVHPYLEHGAGYGKAPCVACPGAKCVRCRGTGEVWAVTALLDAQRRYRALMKAHGTYLKRMVPMTVAVEASRFDAEVLDYVRRREPDEDGASRERDEDVDEYEEMETAQLHIKQQKEKIKGFIWPDGRVRASFNAHVTAVSRFAASNPNVLNLPPDIKDMFIPGLGHVYVGADSEQIHLRIAASRWDLRRYLEALNRGADPHAMTALLCFPDDDPAAFRKSDGFPGGKWDGDYFIPDGTGKWSGNAKKARQTAKKIQYGSMYLALCETVWRIMREDEDSDGNLTFATLELSTVRKLHGAWLDGIPQIHGGWQREIDFFRRHGYLVEPVLGRRRDFLDGENQNELVNFPILGAEGSIMSRATVNVARDLGFDHKEQTGLVHQNYDSMCLEVKAADADAAIALLEREMNLDEPTLPNVRLAGKAAVGKNLKEA